MLTTDPIQRAENRYADALMRGQAWHIETYGETKALLVRALRGSRITITGWTVHQAAEDSTTYLVAAWSYGELHHVAMVELTRTGGLACSCRTRATPGYCRHAYKVGLWAVRQYVPLSIHPHELDQSLKRPTSVAMGATTTIRYVA